MIEVERIALFEKDGKLATLRPQPKTILAAERVNVRAELTGGNKVVVDPAVAWAFGSTHGAGHHATLVSRYDGDLRGTCALAKHDDLDMIFEKRDVFGKVHLFFGLGAAGLAKRQQCSESDEGECA
jgi:hypothetical protein